MTISKAIKASILLILSVGLLSLGVWIAGAGNLVRDLVRFPAWTLGGVLLVLALNLVLVSLRLRELLNVFGVSVPFSVASKASLQGHFASLFFISFFGQAVGRQAILVRYGTRPIAISALTAMERAILFAVSAGMCLLGALCIFDSNDISALVGGIPFLPMAFVACLAVALSLWFGRTTFEKKLIFGSAIIRNFVQIAGIAIITIFAQSLVLAAFVLGGLGLAPDAGVLGLLAAAAVTSFAASLPISVNGWGIREIAAVYAFGAIGITPSTALAISVLVGLSSTAVVLIAFPYVLTKSPAGSELSLQKGKGLVSLPVEKMSAWALSVAASVLIFFQVHIPLHGGVINLNLADPFAVLALAAVASQIIFARQVPRWTVPHFNTILIVILFLIAFSFVNGWQLIGVTQWALAGRLLGWLVLLGYLSIGALVLTHLGKLGASRFVETVVSTSVVIILFHSFLRWIASLGWLDASSLTPNFEGFSGNRNAFAFQLLCCSVLLIAYGGLKTKYLKPLALGKWSISRVTFVSAVHGVILAGLVFTGSKAGMLTGMLLLLLSRVAGFADKVMFRRSIYFGIIVWVFFVVILPLLHDLVLEFLSVVGQQSGGRAGSRVEVQSILSNAVSNQERWESIVRGFELWREAPWIGQGLGVFMEMSSLWFSEPTVIHSTPIWILAEFGLLGAIVLAAALIWMVVFLVRKGVSGPGDRAVLMLLGVFLVFSLVHEIFYQRMFWLILGLCLAVPFRENFSTVLLGKQSRQ